MDTPPAHEAQVTGTKNAVPRRSCKIDPHGRLTWRLALVKLPPRLEANSRWPGRVSIALKTSLKSEQLGLSRECAVLSGVHAPSLHGTRQSRQFSGVDCHSSRRAEHSRAFENVQQSPWSSRPRDRTDLRIGAGDPRWSRSSDRQPTRRQVESSNPNRAVSSSSDGGADHRNSIEEFDPGSD